MKQLLKYSKFNIKYTLFFFLLLFGPVIVLAGIRLDSRAFLMLLIGLFGVIYLYKNIKYITLPYIQVQIVFLMLLCCLLLFISINSVVLEDIYYLSLVLRMFFLFFITVLIISFIKSNKQIIDRYFDYIFYITVINAIIIILMVHIDPLRNFIQSFQYQTLLLQSSGNIRMQALNGMEGATLSAMMFFGAISFFYMSKSGFKEKIFFGLIIYSMIYIGRTGLLFIMLFFIYIIVMHFLKKYKLLFPIFLIPVFLIIYLLITLFLNNLYLLPIEYQYTFRFLTSIGTTESGLPYTIDLLLNDIFIPNPSEHNIWLGSYGISNLRESAYFSDVGYIKMLFTIGYIGLFLYSLIYIAFLFFAMKLKRYEKSFEYVVFIVLFLFLFHFKGNALTFTAVYFLILFSFNISLLRLKNKKKVNSLGDHLDE